MAGQHRLATPIPACTCGAKYNRWHEQTCAIIVERNKRLCKGMGGTR